MTIKTKEQMADEIVEAIVDNLNDRRGVFEDIDSDIYEEIKLTLAKIIVKKINDWTATL
jgi:hypothetical protein